MLLRFCVKFYTKERSSSIYIKAKTPAAAIAALATRRPTLKFTKIELLGDALPAPTASAAELIKEAQKANAAKRKRWIAAKKYEAKAGISPLSIRPKKS